MRDEPNPSRAPKDRDAIDVTDVVSEVYGPAVRKVTFDRVLSIQYMLRRRAHPGPPGFGDARLPGLRRLTE